MIIFELTMPNRGSWNGKWSGDNKVHVITKHNNKVSKELNNKEYCYTWDDGWTACIKVYKMNANTKEYRQLIKNNIGFCGYNWMVDSIIEHGKILKP